MTNTVIQILQMKCTVTVTLVHNSQIARFGCCWPSSGEHHVSAVRLEKSFTNAFDEWGASAALKARSSVAGKCGCQPLLQHCYYWAITAACCLMVFIMASWRLLRDARLGSEPGPWTFKYYCLLRYFVRDWRNYIQLSLIMATYNMFLSHSVHATCWF